MPKNKLDMGDVTATLFIVLGIITIILGFALANVWTEISRFLETSGVLSNLSNFDGTLTAFSCFAFGILYILTGYLITERYKEGQYLATFLGILLIFAFPVGTVIGIIVIYSMVIDDVKNEFTRKLEI